MFAATLVAATLDIVGFFIPLNLKFRASQGLVFDYFVNPENGEVARWSHKVRPRWSYVISCYQD